MASRRRIRGLSRARIFSASDSTAAASQLRNVEGLEDLGVRSENDPPRTSQAKLRTNCSNFGGEMGQENNSLRFAREVQLEDLATMFWTTLRHSPPIYTTNRGRLQTVQLRKVTKTQAFPECRGCRNRHHDHRDTTRKWTMPVHNWGMHFEPLGQSFLTSLRLI